MRDKLNQFWDTWEVIFIIIPIFSYLIYKKKRINKPLMLFFVAYVAYPGMYVFENSSIFWNYIFLFLFIGSSILGFVELYKMKNDS